MKNNLATETTAIVGDLISSFEQQIREQRVALESAEINREFISEQEREKRYAEVNRQNTFCFEELNRLEDQLEHFTSLTSSEELTAALQTYKSETAEIINMKNTFVGNLIRDLKVEEDVYLKSLAEWSKAFDHLVTTSKEKVAHVTSTATQSIKQLEKRLMEQRKDLLKRNKAESEDFFKKHELLETSLANNREEEERKNFKEIIVLRQSKNREFFSTKQNMEKTIQDHDKCLEYMRAVYQLNGEKLNYNLKVLEAKKKENASLILILKKKERFFLNLLKRKNDDFALKYSEFSKTNLKLTDQAKSLARQYRELHKKFEHFERSDLEKYQEIKAISLAKLVELREKIAGINRVIMNQQLGLEVDENQQPTDLVEKIKASETNLDSPQQDVSNRSFSRMSDMNLKKERDTKFGFTDDIQKISNAFTNKMKLELLDLVLAETEFLLDDKIRSEIDSRSSEEEKLLMKMNVIRKVFAIGSQVDLNDLLLKLHLNIIGPDGLTYKQSKVITSLVKLLEAAQTKMALKTSRITAKEKMDAKMNENPQDVLLLEESKNILSKESYDVWKEMDKITLKYYNLLQQRKSLIDDNSALEAKNRELEELLAVYEKDNPLLIYPPTISLSKQ